MITCAINIQHNNFTLSCLPPYISQFIPNITSVIPDNLELMNFPYFILELEFIYEDGTVLRFVMELNKNDLPINIQQNIEDTIIILIEYIISSTPESLGPDPMDNYIVITHRKGFITIMNDDLKYTADLVTYLKSSPIRTILVTFTPSEDL